VADPKLTPFGRYRLVQRLASGGMGELFVALDPGDRLCVLKRMLAQHLDKPDFVQMFLAEARLLQRLRHPHIVDVFEVGEVAGQPFFSMEWVRGRSLRDLVDELARSGKALPTRHVVEVGLQLLRGLHHAHQARDDDGRPMGIVHRDINPHNVLIGWDGQVKLIDFGIAKSDVSGFHTAVGTIKGKFSYMSPEQSAADPIDARSDLFSVGIVLYEALTLENPFARPNVVLALEAIQLHPVSPPSSIRADAAPLDDVLTRALEKNPDLRFAEAASFAEMLAARAPLLHEAPGPLPALMRVVFEADIRAEVRRIDELSVDGDDEPTDPGRSASPARGGSPRRGTLGAPELRQPPGSAQPVNGPTDVQPARGVDGSAGAPRPRAGSAAGPPEAVPDATGASRPTSPDEPVRARRPFRVRAHLSSRPWLGYVALLLLTTLSSFGLTRAVMQPAPAAPAAPAARMLGTLVVRSEPPAWSRLDGPNWLQTPMRIRVFERRGQIRLATDDGVRGAIRYRVDGRRLELDGSGQVVDFEEDLGGIPGRYRFRLGPADARDTGASVRLEWRAGPR